MKMPNGGMRDQFQFVQQLYIKLRSGTGTLAWVAWWSLLAPRSITVFSSHCRWLRTITPDEPLYDPAKGYWRGPVWVISSYLVMHGLTNYGYLDQARKLAAETEALLRQDLEQTGGMNECYNPEDGRPHAGGHFVSWDPLGEHMVEEAKERTDPTSLNPW